MSNTIAKVVITEYESKKVGLIVDSAINILDITSSLVQEIDNKNSENGVNLGRGAG